MRLADNELEVFHEVLEQLEEELAQEWGGEEFEDGKAGEEAMRKFFKRAASTWQFIGHPRKEDDPNQPGPDGVAWRRRRDGRLEMLLLDNKALTRARRVARSDEPSGLLSPSLMRNIPPIINKLHTDPGGRKDVLEAKRLLQRTLQAVMYGEKKLPSGVRRVITNAGGNATGITNPLRREGFSFLNIAKRAALPEADVMARLARMRQRQAAAMPGGGQKELAELLGLPVP
jgi:hypothetical protein